MRTYIGGQEAVTPDEFLELALGTPPELWLGVEGESEEERAARLDAARDILAEHPGLFDTVTRVAAELIERSPALRHLPTANRPAKGLAGALCRAEAA
ncbi:hypothetical protein ACH4UT_27875 [Streptomyces sp. NPDC020799]|uniref:hypothetical protein n=1 Tax=Streptomyces sp. NPDC020799 TaxID=3365091 RepID=UPI0037B42110